MNWDKPSPRQRGDFRDSEKFAAVGYVEPPRPPSELHLVGGPEPKWYPMVRIAGLILPSSWLWLTVCLWWAWRLVGLYARDAMQANSIGAFRLSTGLLIDAIQVFAVFSLVRAVSALASPDRDIRNLSSKLAIWTATSWLFVTALLRIIDVIHCSIEKTPPTPLFWRHIIEDPAAYLLHGGAFTAVVTAFCTAGLARYALGCDGETAQTLAEPMPRARSLALTLGSATAVVAAAAWLAWSQADVARPPSDWGRMPELHALQTFRAGLAEAQAGALR